MSAIEGRAEPPRNGQSCHVEACQYVTDAFWPNTSSGLSSSVESAVDHTEAAAKPHTSPTQQCSTLFNDSRFPIPDSRFPIPSPKDGLINAARGC
ncbi:hypothetical protein, partial [Xanthomonas citri]|uniref:hypothetical protein n=1 Tax=Xanthomonas citri TaxID=346 RepID=UPI001C39546C